MIFYFVVALGFISVTTLSYLRYLPLDSLLLIGLVCKGLARLILLTGFDNPVLG